MWALVTSRLGLMGIAAALIAAVILTQTFRLSHAKHELADLRAADARAAQEVKAHEKAAAAISQKAQAQVATERVRVQTVTRTLIQKVPVYVPAAADDRCVVPVGFVQLHDYAATGVSAPAGGPVEAASGVQLSAVLATVIANYGVAYDWKAEALGWRAWYVAQKAAWEAK
jgi:hypothetical protein